MKILLLNLLLMSSCSLLNKGVPHSKAPRESYQWVYDPYEVCVEQNEFCATGEGKTFSVSDLQARNNLASIFEVKVDSTLNIQTSANQQFPWKAQVNEEVHQSLEQSVSQVLEAVQIKKRLMHQGLSYSLAVLDRPKVSELLAKRLTKIDDELKILWKKKSRLNFRKMMRLFLERDKLGERYSLVSGVPKPSPVGYQELVGWRETRPQVEPLKLIIGAAPEWMSDKLKSLLTEAGFKIVKGDAEKAISINVDSIKEFLNVKGFEKYTFTLKLVSYAGGEKQKVLHVSETVTGRSQGDALLKVKSFFNDYMEQNLAQLELD